MSRAGARVESSQDEHSATSKKAHHDFSESACPENFVDFIVFFLISRGRLGHDLL